MNKIISEVNEMFVLCQGLATLIGEQKKSLDLLCLNLLEMSGAQEFAHDEESDQGAVIHGDFYISKLNGIAMVHDCGVDHKRRFDSLNPEIQNQVW